MSKKKRPGMIRVNVRAQEKYWAKVVAAAEAKGISVGEQFRILLAEMVEKLPTPPANP